MLTQIDLQKARNIARTEIEKAWIEQETRLELEIMNRDLEFNLAKHVRLIPKF